MFKKTISLDGFGALKYTQFSWSTITSHQKTNNHTKRKTKQKNPLQSIFYSQLYKLGILLTTCIRNLTSVWKKATSYFSLKTSMSQAGWWLALLAQVIKVKPRVPFLWIFLQDDYYISSLRGSKHHEG